MQRADGSLAISVIQDIGPGCLHKLRTHTEHEEKLKHHYTHF